MLKYLRPDVNAANSYSRLIDIFQGDSAFVLAHAVYNIAEKLNKMKNHQPKRDKSKPTKGVNHPKVIEQRRADSSIILRKSMSREFRLEIDLPDPFLQWTHEVICAIEKPNLKVFRANDSTALDLPSMNHVLARGSMETINVREWLPLAVQRIMPEMPQSDKSQYLNTRGAGALYWNNAYQSILPAENFLTEGPFCFRANIMISKNIMRRTSKHREMAFKSLIAHELCHSFHCLRYLIPAFKDWVKFKTLFLWYHEERTLKARSWLRNEDQFLDLYHPHSEIEILSTWWPSYAKAWVSAYYKGRLSSLIPQELDCMQEVTRVRGSK